ncbi:MAG: hypothetical protein IKH58_05885 [Bacteroidales bacterium]|nr:hypothetical protein [Bacteroidales bacterium]
MMSFSRMPISMCIEFHNSRCSTSSSRAMSSERWTLSTIWFIEKKFDMRDADYN